MHEPPNAGRAFLSTRPAGRGEHRLALAVVVVSGVIFLATAPFAQVPLARIPAFIPIYQSALAVNDLITAVLLFGQFIFLRSRGLLVRPRRPRAQIFRTPESVSGASTRPRSGRAT